MNMKTIQKYLLTVLVLGATVGCKEKMIELNTNPETVSSTNMPYLFTGATNNFDYRSRWQLQVKYEAMQTMQYITRYKGANSYIDPLNPESKQLSSYSTYYDQFFSDQGNKLQTILDQISYKSETDQLQHADIKAITMVIMAFQQWRLVEQYGAIVYKEAFKAQNEGITRPKYEMGVDIYKDIVANLDQAIETLSKPANANTVEVGNNDYFFGYISKPIEGAGGSNIAERKDYTVQRQLWMKFANLVRLDIAWKNKKVDPAFFESVKNAVLALPDGLMTSLDQGAYYHYPFASGGGDNPDDVQDISQHYAISEPLCNVLNSLQDPRLQYYARPNGLSPINSRNFRAMQALFPDSLAAYGDLMDGNHIFVGHSSNPLYFDKRLKPIANPADGQFVGQLALLFNLKNPNYPAPLTFMDKGKLDTVTELDKFALSLQIASPAQGRYFVKSGGREGKNGNADVSAEMNDMRYDGPGGEYNGIFQRRPVFTYPQQCFLLAYLGVSAGGKSAAEWYEAGVVAAMKELRDDALRYKIQIVVSPSYTVFPNYNPNGQYIYTDTEIAAYLARVPYSAENAINQAWLYFYQMPETAYSWWKASGLPKIVKNDTPVQAAAQPNPYLEMPLKQSAAREELLFPRRGTLPDKNTVNPNFFDIKTDLIASPGFMNWDQTEGRVWWDKQ